MSQISRRSLLGLVAPCAMCDARASETRRPSRPRRPWAQEAYCLRFNDPGVVPGPPATAGETDFDITSIGPAIQREMRRVCEIFRIQADLTISVGTDAPPYINSPYVMQARGRRRALIVLDRGTIAAALSDPSIGGYVLSATLAHEAAHVFQARPPDISDMGIGLDETVPLISSLPAINQQRSRPTSVRPLELHADFMAGWYLSVVGAPPQIADRIASYFARWGNLIFLSEHFHGRPEHRRLAFDSGYQVNQWHMSARPNRAVTRHDASWSAAMLVARLVEEEGRGN